jgi:pimeloyl-ACP methyl ester carboxylesterase
MHAPERNERIVASVEVNDITIDYRSVGNGLPVVLLHGLACGKRMWFHQVRALSPHYRVIVYDARGHGLTDAPDDRARYSPGHLVRDLVGFLDVLRLDRVALVGFSMGGGPALAVAARMPQRISHLVLADVGAGADDGWKIQWLANRWIDFLEREGADAMIADMLRSEQFKFYAGRGTRFRRHMAGLIRATPPAGLRHTLSEVLGKRKSLFRMTETLKSVKVPTLVLLGQQDYLCRNSSRLMAETIPGAALRRIAGAGHITPLEEPRQFNAIVHDFMRA